MKNVLRLVVMVMLLGLATNSFALTVSKPFTVSATISAATGVSIIATKVNAADNVFGSSVSALNFDPMTYNSANGIWVPDHYFAIDVGVTGGSGNPAVAVSYGSESMPAGQTKGLGSKSTATFVKITGAPGSQTETLLAAHGPKKLLKVLSTAENITATEINGGFLRVYVGVYPGGDAGINSAGGEPFTNGDKPGSYSGTLTLTATIP